MTCAIQALSIFHCKSTIYNCDYTLATLLEHWQVQIHHSAYNFIVPIAGTLGQLLRWLDDLVLNCTDKAQLAEPAVCGLHFRYHALMQKKLPAFHLMQGLGFPHAE